MERELDILRIELSEAYAKLCMQQSQLDLAREGLEKIKDGDASRENIFPSLQEKSDAKYMFLISIKDIKTGQEIIANYNLYTYPKTGIGLQMI